MLNNDELYAVSVDVGGKLGVCMTWNDTHHTWTPAIFYKEEDAISFMKEMENCKGHEKNVYVVTKVNVMCT